MTPLAEVELAIATTFKEVRESTDPSALAAAGPIIAALYQARATERLVIETARMAAAYERYYDEVLPIMKRMEARAVPQPPERGPLKECPMCRYEWREGTPPRHNRACPAAAPAAVEVIAP